MEPYLHATQGDEKLALTLYIWHTELTAAIQQMLGITEVVLRNAMDAHLQIWNQAQGGSSWLLEEPATPLRSLSAGKRKDALHRATRQAALRDTEHRRYGAAVQHDDVEVLAVPERRSRESSHLGRPSVERHMGVRYNAW